MIDLVEVPYSNNSGKKKGTRRLAPGTISKILQTLKVMLEQACDEGLLTDYPSRYVKSVRDNYRRKGVLTPDEVRALLNPDIWDDYRHYAINLLTLSTGLRLSEVRGLLISQMHPTHIEVKTAWEEQHGLKEPKWGSMRDIPITDKVYGMLQEVVKRTHPQDIIFYGKDYDNPMSKSFIEKKLYKAFNKIGIYEQQRKLRNLTYLHKTDAEITPSLKVPISGS